MINKIGIPCIPHSNRSNLKAKIKHGARTMQRQRIFQFWPMRVPKGQRKLCCGSTRHTPTQPRMAERLPTKQTGQFEPMAAGSLPRWNCLTGCFLHVKNIRFSHDFPFILRIEEMPFYKLALPELGSLVSRPGASPRGFLVEVEDIPRIHVSVPFYA